MYLRTFVLIVSAHPYCTRKFTRHVMHESTCLVIKWTMIGQMAIALTLPGFNDLGHLVTPIFLLLDHFLYRFSMFSEKMKKIYWLEVWIFCKLHHRIPFFLALRLSVWWFQMPLEGLSFVKTWITFGIIYATDPLLQNMTKIVCFRWLAFNIFNYKPLQTMLNCVHQFFK